MKVILAAIASAALATAAMAAEPAARPTAEAAKKPEAKKDPNRMVCKKTPVVGTRFPTKVCRTQTEWERQAEIDRKNLDDAQRVGLQNCGTNPCS